MAEIVFISTVFGEVYAIAKDVYEIVRDMKQAQREMCELGELCGTLQPTIQRLNSHYEGNPLAPTNELKELKTSLDRGKHLVNKYQERKSRAILMAKRVLGRQTPRAKFEKCIENITKARNALIAPLLTDLVLDSKEHGTMLKQIMSDNSAHGEHAEEMLRRLEEGNVALRRAQIQITEQNTHLLQELAEMRRQVITEEPEPVVELNQLLEQKIQEKKEEKMRNMTPEQIAIQDDSEWEDLDPAKVVTNFMQHVSVEVAAASALHVSEVDQKKFARRDQLLSLQRTLRDQRTQMEKCIARANAAYVYKEKVNLRDRYLQKEEKQRARGRQLPNTQQMILDSATETIEELRKEWGYGNTAPDDLDLWLSETIRAMYTDQKFLSLSRFIHVQLPTQLEDCQVNGVELEFLWQKLNARENPDGKMNRGKLLTEYARVVEAVGDELNAAQNDVQTVLHARTVDRLGAKMETEAKQLEAKLVALNESIGSSLPSGPFEVKQIVASVRSAMEDGPLLDLLTKQNEKLRTLQESIGEIGGLIDDAAQDTAILTVQKIREAQEDQGLG
jgi:hypothetical protein